MTLLYSFTKCQYVILKLERTKMYSLRNISYMLESDRFFFCTSKNGICKSNTSLYFQESKQSLGPSIEDVRSKLGFFFTPPPLVPAMTSLLLQKCLYFVHFGLTPPPPYLGRPLWMPPLCFSRL